MKRDVGLATCSRNILIDGLQHMCSSLFTSSLVTAVYHALLFNRSTMNTQDVTSVEMMSLPKCMVG